jgi:carbon storage regulator
MLVLTRKVGERILIGDHVSVMVVAINGSNVRLGLEAPCNLPIVRAELAERVSTVSGQPEPPGQTHSRGLGVSPANLRP